MTARLLYNLGDYVRKYFFTDEKKGEYVYPIIDSSFINQYCHYAGLEKSNFLLSLGHDKAVFLTDDSPIEVVLGIIAIQLYAASKMENADGFTAANYRQRICECLGIDTSDWQNWVKDNQDYVWSRYYAWCEDESFLIDNPCRSREGKDRYVQYPKVHSAQVLNREDLKRFAAEFIAKGIVPNEDLTQDELWNILGFPSNNLTNRARRIIESSWGSAKKQIFQYYLSWDGEYSDARKTTKRAEKSSCILRLIQEEDEWILDICNEIQRVKQIPLFPTTNIFNELKPYYTFKRPNTILFEKDPLYEDYTETRYLNENDESIALFVNTSKGFHEQDVIQRFGMNALVKLNPKRYPQFYTTEKRPYRLYGGLRISRDMPNYLLDAPPILDLDKDLRFYIDDKPYQGLSGYNRLPLGIGVHKIKIPGYKSIGIHIVAPDIKDFAPWNNNPRWLVDNKKARVWDVDFQQGQIVGLDYHAYSSNGTASSTGSVLYRWCKAQQSNKAIQPGEPNVAIRMLNIQK